MNTLEEQLAIVQLHNRAKFPHNSALPRLGNNRKQPNKVKARRIAVLAQGARKMNR